MLSQWIGDLVGQMHNNKISKTQLAEHMGVSREYVSMVINGHRDPAGAETRFRTAVEEIVAKRRTDDAVTYRTWRDKLAKSGKTPEELLAQYEAAGMTDYVKQVRAVIQQMEGLA